MSTKSLTTSIGRVYFTADEGGIVWAHTARANLGGWRLDRFGAKLDAAWMRAWQAACLEGGE